MWHSQLSFFYKVNLRVLIFYTLNEFSRSSPALFPFWFGSSSSRLCSLAFSSTEGMSTISKSIHHTSVFQRWRLWQFKPNFLPCSATARPLAAWPNIHPHILPSFFFIKILMIWPSFSLKKGKISFLLHSWDSLKFKLKE